ncbi:MAG: ABC transporter permease [Candidatus Sumerlaeaceae bacterium]
MDAAGDLCRGGIVKRCRIARKPLLLLSGIILVVVFGLAIMGPVRVTTYDPNATNYEETYQPPSAAHPAGTDSLGRDMAARLLVGARISLRIALIAAAINLLIGVVWGAVAGYSGGLTDTLMMRIVDVLYGVPTILVVIMLMVYLDQGIRNIYIAIGLTYWLNMARLVRGEVLSLKSREFVAAARALGAGPARILGRHMLPNAVGVILVTLTLFIPEAIFIEAFLSYIGLGVPAPDASWGSLAAEGTRNLRSSPHLLIYPAGAICITILAFNILGDALRDKVSRG